MKQFVKRAGIPVLTTVLGVVLGFLTSRIPETLQPAELKLELVGILNSANREFGEWKVVRCSNAVVDRPWEHPSEDELVKIPDATLGEKIRKSSLQVHEPLCFKRNDVDVSLYALDWRSRIQPRNMNVSKNLKERIKGSDSVREYADDIADAEQPDEILRKRLKDGVEKDPKTWRREAWRDLAAIFIRNQIVAPKVACVLRNTGDHSATIYGFKFTRVYSTGGAAGAGGTPLEPANLQQTVILDWNRDSELMLEKPLVVDPTDTVLLQFSPTIHDATSGEGSGTLAYRVHIVFHDGSNLGEYYVGTFEQPDDPTNFGPSMFVSRE